MDRLRHLLVLLLLTGCAATGAGTAPVAEAPPAPPASAELAIHWGRDSAEYPAALVQAYALAG
ncbi:MAG TPA: hypothetical protein VGG06_12675 [Thermoanaerobaculia bacterium]|jgi:hypothetical protein